MIVWNNLTVGDHRAACPACSKSDKDTTMGITIASDDHGVAHCFRCNYIETRHNQREQTPAERHAYACRMNALRQRYDAERRQRQVEAAAAAGIRWSSATPAGDHPYLTGKGVMAHGIRIEAGHSLLIPMRDNEGRLHSLQTIAPDGAKRFMPNGRVKACYHAIGRPSSCLVVCEGYATGATIHEDTGSAVAIAFNAGNLVPVAKALRSKFPGISLVIAADDDWKTKGNPGIAAATEAARVVGGMLAVPQFGDLPRGDKDTDFNDLHRLAGSVEAQQ